ncbi:MAG: Gfo/Idh/MocA family protein [Geminicoccaceae bacterium]
MRCMLVGTGFGATHSCWLKAIPCVEIDTLIYNKDKVKADKLMREHGINQIGTDAESILCKKPFDLVSIVSPPSTHAYYLRAALDAGVPAVVDKPLAESIVVARDMQAMSESARCSTFTFFQWLLHPAAMRLREIRESGRLGKITHVEGGFDHSFLSSNQTNWPWRHRAELAGGGSLGDMGVHLFDLVRFVTGFEWRTISARCGQAHPVRQGPDGLVSCATDDFADVNLVALDGLTTGRIVTSRVAIGEHRLWIRLYGSQAAVGAIFDPDTSAASILTTDGAVQQCVEEFPPDNFNPYLPILAALRGEVRNAPVPASIADGLAAQSLMCAAVSASQNLAPNLSKS